MALQWRHNERDVVSNHQRLHWRFVQVWVPAKIKENIKAPRHFPFFAENSPVTGEFPAQKPVTRKMFPFDDAIMG